MILYVMAITSDFKENFAQQEKDLLKVVKTMSTCKDQE